MSSSVAYLFTLRNCWSLGLIRDVEIPFVTSTRKVINKIEMVALLFVTTYLPQGS